MRFELLISCSLRIDLDTHMVPCDHLYLVWCYCHGEVDLGGKDRAKSTMVRWCSDSVAFFAVEVLVFFVLVVVCACCTVAQSTAPQVLHLSQLALSGSWTIIEDQQWDDIA